MAKVSELEKVSETNLMFRETFLMLCETNLMYSRDIFNVLRDKINAI